MGYVQFTSEILLRISEAPDSSEVAPWAINSESIVLRAARTHNLIPSLETVVDNMRVSKMPEPKYRWKYSSIMTKKLSKQQGSSHWERTEFWEVCEAVRRESAVKTELTLPQKNKQIFERTKNLTSWCVSVNHLHSDIAMQSATMMVSLTITTRKTAAMEAWFVLLSFSEVVPTWTLSGKYFYFSEDNNNKQPPSKIACICEATGKPMKKRSKKYSCPKLEARSKRPKHGIQYLTCSQIASLICSA